MDSAQFFENVSPVFDIDTGYSAESIRKACLATSSKTTSGTSNASSWKVLSRCATNLLSLDKDVGAYCLESHLPYNNGGSRASDDTGKRFCAIIRKASSHVVTSFISGRRSANNLKPSWSQSLTNAEAFEQLSEACSNALHHRVNSRAEYTHCNLCC